jgi:uncharacterized membrane protein
MNNKARGWPHWISIILAIAGLVVAGYLTYSDFTLTSTLCAPGGGCDTVRQSQYSQVLGVSVALIGLLGYLGILAVLILEQSSPFFARNGPMLVFGLSLIGFLYSAYLTYLEAFAIRAFCPYCVASAIIMTAIFGIATFRALRATAA